MKLSERQFRQLTQRERCQGGRKYRNDPTLVDGLRFASKLEARRYGELRDLQAAGVVAWFIRQPSFDLPGGVRYRADFLVVWSDHVTVEDCKGMETPVFKLKRRLFEDSYPKASLRLITRKDVR